MEGTFWKKLEKEVQEINYSLELEKICQLECNLRRSHK